MPQLPPQPRALSQEEQILAQARGQLSLLLPRLETTRKSLECLLETRSKAYVVLLKIETVETIILSGMLEAQTIQLAAALEEGEREKDHLEKVIAQITSPIKLFRPSMGPTQGDAA